MSNTTATFAVSGPDAKHNKRLLCAFAHVPHLAGEDGADAVDRHLATLDWFEGPCGEATAVDRDMYIVKHGNEFIEVEK